MDRTQLQSRRDPVDAGCAALFEDLEVNFGASEPSVGCGSGGGPRQVACRANARAPHSRSRPPSGRASRDPIGRPRGADDFRLVGSMRPSRRRRIAAGPANGRPSLLQFPPLSAGSLSACGPISFASPDAALPPLARFLPLLRPPSSPARARWRPAPTSPRALAAVPRLERSKPGRDSFALASPRLARASSRSRFRSQTVFSDLEELKRA